MLYNVPILTGVEVTPQEIQMLSEQDVIHSVKWSRLEVSRIHDTRLLCVLDFPIFAGIDLIAFGALAVGADGWISGLPMMVPALAKRLFRLLTVDKSLDLARGLWYRIPPLIHLEYRALGTENGSPHWLAVCREAAEFRGIDLGVSRGPLTRVHPPVRNELKSILERLGQL